MARGLSVEGARSQERRALDFATDAVVTCTLDEPVGSVRERVAQSAYRFAIVVGGDEVVLGRLRNEVLDGDPNVPAGSVMEPGPVTSRPNLNPAKLFERLRGRGLNIGILTDPDGRLMGVVRARDLEPFAAA